MSMFSEKVSRRLVSSLKQLGNNEISLENNSEVKISYSGNSYDYIAESDLFKLPFGEYEFEYETDLDNGGVTVGLIGGPKSQWITNKNHFRSERAKQRVFVGIRGMQAKLIIASCYQTADSNSNFQASIRNLRLQRAGFLESVKVYSRSISIFSVESKSELLKKRIALQRNVGSKILKLLRLLPQRIRPRQYFLTSLVDAGYACRCISSVKTATGETVILTANTGDDSLSLIPVKDGELQHPNSIRLPTRSAPIALSTFGVHSEHLGVCCFNFDGTDKVFDKSCMLAIPHFEKHIGTDVSFANLGSEIPVLLERPGHFGFRGICSWDIDQGQKGFAIVDRDGCRIYVFGVSNTDSSLTFKKVIELGEKTEPVGITSSRNSTSPELITFYISCRKKAALITVSFDVLTHNHEITESPLKGLSRSSVVIGRFCTKDQRYLAIGLWGGDPEDLNSVSFGEIAVMELRSDGRIGSVQYFGAGIHPTDIACGDFDGDGIDELAVLNYGNGININERTTYGNVEIYKNVGPNWKRVSKIRVPSPRIAHVADVDQDGRVELISSLFFEKKLAVIKCC